MRVFQKSRKSHGKWLNMNKYIFYTTEGATIAPNENYEVGNCQVLGIASGYSTDNAQKNLLGDNPWILNAGYSPREFICRQLT